MNEMRRYTTDQLLSYLDGSLGEPMKYQLHRDLEQSADLREELRALHVMQGAMQEAVAFSSDTALKPFFTDRVLRALDPAQAQSAPVEDLTYFLIRVFRPVAIVGVFLVLCLAMYNVNLSSNFTSSTTTAEAILALPPVNTMTVYDLDLYGIEYTSELTLP